MPIKVFLTCSGLGNVNRGYESFTQECFNALSDSSELDLTLFKGKGPSEAKQKTLWNLPRTSRISHLLSKFAGKKSAQIQYQIEQSTFAFSLLPYIQREKPDVIYFSDHGLGYALWLWRRWTHSKYHLLFSNGGPLGPPFPRWDHVQQVAPPHAQNALDAGQPPDRQSIVPYGIEMSPDLVILTPEQKTALRTALGLPTDRPILLSVGVINTSHKRMDYVIREIASLTEERPYLVMLGQRDSETPQIEALAQQELGKDHYTMRTVPHSQVRSYYQAADVWVLASLGEGLPRVSLEAMSHGLPCLAHDYDLMQYVLGKHGYLGNFTQKGELAKLITSAMKDREQEEARRQRHQDCYQRFSWQSLKSEYISMIQRCISSELHQT